MFKGTSASAGIGIGKAVIVEEAELVITRNEVADAEGFFAVSNGYNLCQEVYCKEKSCTY